MWRHPLSSRWTDRVREPGILCRCEDALLTLLGLSFKFDNGANSAGHPCRELVAMCFEGRPCFYSSCDMRNACQFNGGASGYCSKWSPIKLDLCMTGGDYSCQDAECSLCLTVYKASPPLMNFTTAAYRPSSVLQRSYYLATRHTYRNGRHSAKRARQRSSFVHGTEFLIVPLFSTTAYVSAIRRRILRPFTIIGIQSRQRHAYPYRPESPASPERATFSSLKRPLRVHPDVLGDPIL